MWKSLGIFISGLLLSLDYFPLAKYLLEEFVIFDLMWMKKGVAVRQDVTPNWNSFLSLPATTPGIGISDGKTQWVLYSCPNLCCLHMWHKGKPWCYQILQKFVSTKGVHDSKLLSQAGTDWSVWRDAGAEWMQFALPGACGAGRRASGGNTFPIASAPGLWIREDLGQGKREAKTVNIIQIKKAQGQKATALKVVFFLSSEMQTRKRELPSSWLPGHCAPLHSMSVKVQFRRRSHVMLQSPWTLQSLSSCSRSILSQISWSFVPHSLHSGTQADGEVRG